MSKDVLIIEVRDDGLFETRTNKRVDQFDIATMIISGQPYKVLDSESGEDLTRQIGRFINGRLNLPEV